MCLDTVWMEPTIWRAHASFSSAIQFCANALARCGRLKAKPIFWLSLALTEPSKFKIKQTRFGSKVFLKYFNSTTFFKKYHSFKYFDMFGCEPVTKDCIIKY
ncbi:hypothetical protein QYE76_024179 [Lolium multiflorum]|uniref:Uncharacterized protein n=1 Tax=Lolium multiflorum TaxID=4521 RepID=A0AAD8VT16_LOLMU|nr:hypothetical protein QYE76_024179 [Lolium multiflorum]